MWLENPVLLELPSPYKFPAGRTGSRISDAVDILGVYVIYQIVGHLALSWWSRGINSPPLLSPKYEEGRVLLGIGPEACWHTESNSSTMVHLATKGFGMAKRAKIVVA